MFFDHNGMKQNGQTHTYGNSKQHVDNLLANMSKKKTQINQNIFEISENEETTHENSGETVEQCLEGIYSCNCLW